MLLDESIDRYLCIRRCKASTHEGRGSRFGITHSGALFHLSLEGTDLSAYGIQSKGRSHIPKDSRYHRPIAFSSHFRLNREQEER